MKRILVTGASGMLGATLAKMLSKEFDVYATGNSDFENSPGNYKKFDLSNESYDELIAWSEPEIIIHCAALTNGNYCKEHPNDAFNINGVSIDKLLNATNENVKIIYISTDAVFPSKLHLAKESDAVFPENVYGKSKELGEFFLINSDREYLIIRTTIVGLNENKNKSGFVEWIINSLKNNESIGLFSDVIFTPISIWDLASELKYLINTDAISAEILHIAGAEICTKFEFGMALAEALELNTGGIQKSEISAFKERAKRCSDQSFDCTYYQEKYNRKLPDLKETILSIKKQYHEEY